VKAAHEAGLPGVVGSGVVAGGRAAGSGVVPGAVAAAGAVAGAVEGTLGVVAGAGRSGPFTPQPPSAIAAASNAASDAASVTACFVRAAGRRIIAIDASTALLRC
jgi:hypothetical protein